MGKAGHLSVKSPPRRAAPPSRALRGQEQATAPPLMSEERRDTEPTISVATLFLIFSFTDVSPHFPQAFLLKSLTFLK